MIAYSPSMSKLEKEIALVIDSPDPESTIRRVSNLESLGTYTLRPGGTLRLHDTYFETASGSLGRKRINLRVRQTNKASLITVKWNPRLLQWNRSARRELELPWSNESLDKALYELSKSGIVIRSSQSLRVDDPVESLKRMGLRTVQNRETVRDTKIVSTEKNRLDLAELAIDRVTYHFDLQDVSLYELEAEAKDQHSDGALDQIREILLGIFGSELRPWKWGKLVTGKMIAKLLSAHMLEDMFENNHLNKLGLERLEKALTRGGI